MATNPSGLILAGLGHGTIPQPIRKVTSNLPIPVVRASRTGSGIVSKVPQDVEGRAILYVIAYHLKKARILLMWPYKRNALARIWNESLKNTNPYKQLYADETDIKRPFVIITKGLLLV